MRRNSTNQSLLPSAPTDNEVLADRHTLVLTSIIHKKVVHLAADKDEENLPNEETRFCKSSKETVPSGSHLDITYEEAPQQDECNKRKNDIIIQMSKLKVFQDNSESYTEEISFNQKVCPICSEEYKPGDDIAWSKNEECVHAFHTDCIVPWLMDHDDCPMCRNDYLSLKEI